MEFSLDDLIFVATKKEKRKAEAMVRNAIEPYIAYTQAITQKNKYPLEKIVFQRREAKRKEEDAAKKEKRKKKLLGISKILCTIYKNIPFKIKGSTMPTKTTQIQIRTTDEIKEALAKKAKDLGFTNLSEYMLFVALNAEIRVIAKGKIK